MLNYATLGTNDPTRAKSFYDTLLAPEGFVGAFDHPSGGRIYSGPGGTMFGILAPFDGQPATPGNGTMIGFHLASRDAVASFHARALALGATDDGAPGTRGAGDSGAYLAYLRDPDGNKLCAYNIVR